MTAVRRRAAPELLAAGFWGVVFDNYFPLCPKEAQKAQGMRFEFKL